MTNAQPYQYTESGLDNVWIEGVQPITDHAGDICFEIDNLHGLHRAIAQIIVSKSGLSGRELKFLRSELGLTQDQLADVLHKESLTVSRWERGENSIDPNAETVVRMLAIERLGLKKVKDVAGLAKLSISEAQTCTIRIDGRDPANYKALRQRAA
jgi:DNA-binding transcriptional regulator YiaG